MASTPSNTRTSFLANTGISKSTPTNSPFSRTLRSPTKPRGPYESGLFLKRIIGTTVTSPTCFDTLHDADVFAYTAGAAAVVVNADSDGTFKQRFYRARPTALPQNTNLQSYGAPSTPTHSANDSRNRSSRDSILPYTPNTHGGGSDWSDSPGSKTWTSRERIKAATCLSLSRDGKFLAVGETGYSPRVLIFSLQDGSSDVPVAILNEHTFGVRAVAFSTDGRYLASIGHPNDGFLYVWTINPRTGGAKLHSSNKCTSNIKQMLWLGKNVITVGTRHIKTWKVEEKRSVSPTKRRYNLDGTPIPVPTPPTLKTLVGRNVLLGPLVDAIFTAMATICDQKAIVCSDKGDLCLLDDSDGHKLTRIGESGFSITSLAIDTLNRQINIGGMEGKTKSVSLDALLTPMTPPQSPMPTNELVAGSTGTTCAMGFMNHRLVTVDSKHSIRVSLPVLDQINISQPPIVPFTAHGDAVLGVRLLSVGNKLNSAFLTWSADGTIMFWNGEGQNTREMHVVVDQLPCAGEADPMNQCNIVQPSKDGSYLITGDRYGVLRIIETDNETCLFEARAHSSDILDISVCEVEDRTMIVSCGRDRMLQIFSKENGMWDLTQTIDEHTASVCGVLFTESGDRMLSCSADRTIHIRQMVTRENESKALTVAVPERIVTLKTSPTSMVLGRGDQMGMVVVSQLDRSASTYELSSGKCMASFRAIDNESADAVALDGLQICTPDSVSERPTVIAGFSSTDKSIRVYDALSGKFLDREWGHTSAVTDIALLEQSNCAQKTIISTGSDGTIMIWELNETPSILGDPVALPDSEDLLPPKDALAIRLPLRRVLSRSELNEFQRISPISTPTGRTSPPRIMKRRTSRYGLSSSQSPSLPPPLPYLTGPKHLHTTSDDSGMPRKKSMSRMRARSRSPPPSPRLRESEKTVSRRPSLASLHSENGGSLRGRTKSSPNISEFGSLNMATEQTCRQLKAYRKKLLSNESVREDGLAELEKELRLTMAALADRTAKCKLSEGGVIDEEVMEGILDKASDRLVSLFNEKLRLSKVDSFDSIAEGSTLGQDDVKDESVSPTTTKITEADGSTDLALLLKEAKSSTLLRREINKGVLEDATGKENAQFTKAVVDGIS